MRSKPLCAMLAVLCFCAPAHAQTKAAPPTVPSGPRDKSAPIVPSLFYSPQEARQIHLAINSYLKYTTGEEGSLTRDEADLLNRLAALFGKKESKHSAYYTYPQFFLKSLVFHSADDWSVWLNDMRITPARREIGELRVLEIGNDSVKVEWTPTPVNMDRVNTTWSTAPNDEIVVDQNRGKVIFSLRPNQTFSAYKMRVLEGKMLPVTVGIAEDRPPEPVAKAIEMEEVPGDNAPAPLTGAPDPDADRKGLGGLINSYQNLGQDPTKP